MTTIISGDGEKSECIRSEDRKERVKASGVKTLRVREAPFWKANLLPCQYVRLLLIKSLEIEATETVNDEMQLTGRLEVIEEEAVIMDSDYGCFSLTMACNLS